MTSARPLFHELKCKLIIGMIHLGPLPGTPFHERGTMPQILERAVASAQALKSGGASGCLIQTADRAYDLGTPPDPARVAAMAIIARAVADATGPQFMVGCQIMRNGDLAALAVAKVAKLDFIRVGALVGCTLTSSGLMQPIGTALAAYRAQLDAWDIAVIADIHSMQFRWHGEDKPLEAIAAAARQMGADAVAVGTPDDRLTASLMSRVRAAHPHLPLFLAGYSHHGNIAQVMGDADGTFVGTCLEKERWGGPIDEEKVRSYVAGVHACFAHIPPCGAQ